MLVYSCNNTNSLTIKGGSMTKETIFSFSKKGYKNGLVDGAEKERERIVKIIHNYGLKHNSHPYFLDVINAIKESKK
jgi:hypothetical protein